MNRSSHRLSLCSRYFSDNGHDAAFQYCRDLVKSRDHDNFLCMLLLPNRVRHAAFAIRAFNIEIAQIQDVTSETHISEMRMKFWKETLDLIYQDKPPSHPVAVALAVSLQQHKLTKRWFKRLLDARSERLTEPPFRSLTAAESYGENAFSPVLYLLLETLDVKDVTVDHAASHLGKAASLVTLIRSTLYHSQRRKVILPTDLMIKHDIADEDILRGRRKEQLNEVVFDIASSSHIHLQKVKAMEQSLSKESMKVFLPYIPISMFLRRLQIIDFDVYHPKLNERQWTLSLKLLYSSLTGSIFK